MFHELPQLIAFKEIGTRVLGVLATVVGWLCTAWAVLFSAYTVSGYLSAVRGWNTFFAFLAAPFCAIPVFGWAAATFMSEPLFGWSSLHAAGNFFLGPVILDFGVYCSGKVDARNAKGA